MPTGGVEGIFGRFLRSLKRRGEKKRGEEEGREAYLPICRRLREVRGMRDGWMDMADTKLWLVPGEIYQSPKWKVIMDQP